MNKIITKALKGGAKALVAILLPIVIDATVSALKDARKKVVKEETTLEPDADSEINISA